MTRTAPPRLARRVATWLAARDDREFFLGDLEEAFFRDALPRLGPRRARRWYRRQVVRSALPLLARRASRRERPSPKGDGMLHATFQDLRFAIRQMRRRPGFAAVALVTLALGIGANTAIFSLVHGILLEPLPYADADRLAYLWTRSLSGEFQRGSVTGPDFEDWRERNRSFESLAAYTTMPFVFRGGAEPERLAAARVTANFFDVLGVGPLLGRTFTPDEERLEAGGVVVLSHGFWQQQLGGRDDVLGTTVTLGRHELVVVGVMPPHFRFPARHVRAWAPLPLDHPALQARGEHLLTGLGRLREGTTLAAARADLDAVARDLAREYPDTNGNRGVFVNSLRDEIVGGIERPLLLLQGAVLLVLLIACVNVANLLVAHAVERRREIAVRAALGAGRLRLFRQMLVEGLVLSAAGGAAGVLLARWGVTALLALNPDPLPRHEAIGLDPAVLGFTAALCMLAGIVFALAPAMRGKRLDLQAALREGGRAGAGRSVLRQATIALESALALVLLVGAGLLVGSFVRVLLVDPGFRPDGLLALELSLPSERYPDNASQVAFVERALERLEALGAVESAAVTSHLPIDGDYWRYGFRREEWPEPAPDAATPKAAYRLVSADYFATMGIPVVEGRGFGPRDVASAPRVIVINRTMAERFFAGEDPLGKRVEFYACRDTPCEIVGVVGDVKHFGLEAAEDPAMYGSFAQKPAAWMRDQHFVVRTTTDPLEAVGAAKEQVRSIDPTLAWGSIGTMAGKLDASVASRRFLAILLAVFAGVALVLAAGGIYGLIAYSVSRRRHEIGVRMALGARARDILGLVMRQGLTGATVGLAVGVVAALGLGRWLQGMLFAVEPTDPLIFGGVSLLLLAVAFLACLVPARRGVRTDPLVALRDE